MERKRFFYSVGLSLMALFLVVAFSGVTLAKKAPETIKVSGVISLTGKMASQGVQLAHAYQIYIDKVNEAGGVYVKEFDKKIPVEFRVLDDESDGLKTQSQLETANSWGAVANLGGLGCSSFELGTPIAQKNKMTWVGPGCGGWAPHQHGNTWMYSTFHKTPIFSPLVFDMILQGPPPIPKKVAIFEINQLDCQESAEAWTKAAKEKGFEIVFHQKYPVGTSDFSALITSAKAAGADILLGYPTPPEGPILIKQMKELDWAPKVTYLVRAPESSNFGPTLGELADYVVTPVAWSSKLQMAENDYLNKMMVEKFNEKCDPVAGSAYAAAQVLVAAIEKAGTLDRQAVRDAIKNIDMETVSGRIHFSEEGYALDKLLLILQWMDGDTRIVYRNAAGEAYGDQVPTAPLKWQPAWSER